MEDNKSFCLAPWVHAYISPLGERRICCASIDNQIDIAQNTQIPLQDFWNGPYIKSIRCKMLKGEKLPQCQVCDEKILSIDIYKNYFNKKLFPHLMAEAISRTREDGHTDMQPISFNYRISNVCNFKCRMCSDEASSAIENENKRMNRNADHIDHWTNLENKKKLNQFIKDVAEKELWNAVNEKSIQEIYWVGGEPLLMKFHWEVMNQLVESKHSLNTWVRYNTNLSVLSFKQYNLLEILPQFKNVELLVSIDGTHEIGEYIRDGLIWKEWVKNLEQCLFLKDIYGRWAVTLDITLTSPGLFSLKKLIDLAVNLKLNMIVKTTYSFDSTIIMSPLMIPRIYLDEILDDLIIYAISFLSVHPPLFGLIRSLQHLKKRKTFEEEYPNWLSGITIGKTHLHQIDIFRNKPDFLNNVFKDNHNGLYNWWIKIPTTN